jgi:hypothetical protein
MTPLSLAYVFAAGMIAALIGLAKWNQRQGWRKRRGHWLEVQSTAAIEALAAGKDPVASDAAMAGDLRRLNQSLVAHGDSQRPAMEKENDLAESR